MAQNVSMTWMRAFLFLLVGLSASVTALPVPSIPAAATWVNGAATSEADSETQPSSSSDSTWNDFFGSSIYDFMSFPVRHWALVFCIAGPCLLLGGIIVHLNRQRKALHERQLEMDLHRFRIAQIEQQRTEEMESEMRQLAKLGVDPSRVRMIEPGVYVETDGSDDDYD